MWRWCETPDPERRLEQMWLRERDRESMRPVGGAKRWLFILLKDPERGDIIPGTRGARKVGVASDSVPVNLASPYGWFAFDNYAVDP